MLLLGRKSFALGFKAALVGLLIFVAAASYGDKYGAQSAQYSHADPLQTVTREWPLLISDSGVLMTDDLAQQLDAIAQQLLSWQTLYQIDVVGHTDSLGGDLENLLLSLRRAEAAGDVLAEHGVRDGWIVLDGMGEFEPVAPNDTVEGRAKNRRVVVRATGVPAAAQPPAVLAQGGPL